jgi:pimeloyl-ACP methyl ester carboxylesterase
MRISQLPMLVVLAGLLASCQSIGTNNYAEKENRRDFTIDAAGDSLTVSMYPRTYSALAGPAFSLVLLSPVLVSDEVLWNSGSASLIPWFNARGVTVWLVHIPAKMSLERFGRDALPQVTTAIRKNSNEENWVMGGVSLGGQAVAQYLHDAPRNATVSGMLVKAAFFLGTGFDYSYPGSFGKRLALAQNGADANLCAADFCRRFFTELAPRIVASRHTLFDAAGKPVWRESLDTVQFPDKGVRVMFVNGKIDNVAPSESVYKFYVKMIGDETKNSPDARFVLPGKMNRHGRDFNHTMTLASDNLASEVLPEIMRWIDL